MFYEENVVFEYEPITMNTVPRAVRESKRTKDIDDLAEEIRTLRTTGLLDVQDVYLADINDTQAFVMISQKGFEVVYEHDLKRQQAQSNTVIALLTIVLALSAMIQTASGLLSPDSLVRMLFLGILLVTVVSVLVYFVWKEIL